MRGNPWPLVIATALGALVPFLLFRDMLAVYAYWVIVLALWTVGPWAWRKYR